MVVRVTVVFSPAARDVREVPLELEAGAVVLQAVKRSRLLEQFPEIERGHEMVVGVWGKRAAPDQVLRDLDRVEIYRPLKVDPKLARRARFMKQGAGSAGLFARKRPGAKAGY